jgi:hypothetical protein
MQKSTVRTCKWALSKVKHTYFFTELTLVSAFSIMLGLGVLDNVVLSQDSQTANFAVILSNRQRKLRIMEDGAMNTVVKSMAESQVTASTI